MDGEGRRKSDTKGENMAKGDNEQIAKQKRELIKLLSKPLTQAELENIEKKIELLDKLDK